MVFSSPWGTRVHPPNIDWQLLGCEGQCQRLRFSGGQNRHGPHPPAALESPGGLVRGPWTASQSFTQRSREGLRTGVFKFPDDADTPRGEANFETPESSGTHLPVSPWTDTPRPTQAREQGVNDDDPLADKTQSPFGEGDKPGTESCCCVPPPGRGPSPSCSLALEQRASTGSAGESHFHPQRVRAGIFPK